MTQKKGGARSGELERGRSRGEGVAGVREDQRQEELVRKGWEGGKGWGEGRKERGSGRRDELGGRIWEDSGKEGREESGVGESEELGGWRILGNKGS